MKMRKILPKFVDRLSLGKEGLKVSPFCLGMVRSEEAIVAAFDAGINFFFFTADMHWPFYEHTRKGIQKLLKRGGGIRGKIVIGVVSYSTQPEFCRRPFQEALDAVPGLDTLDVLIAGGAYSHEYLFRLPVYQDQLAMGAFGAKAIGTTFHDRVAARIAANHHLVDIAYLRYNPGHPGARKDVFAHLAADRRTLIYNFKSTLGGVSPQRCAELGITDDFWKPRVTDYYRFALTRSEIDGILCSINSEAEIQALAEALEEGPLDEEQDSFLMKLARLDAADMTVDGRKLGRNSAENKASRETGLPGSESHVTGKLPG